VGGDDEVCANTLRLLERGNREDDEDEDQDDTEGALEKTLAEEEVTAIAADIPPYGQVHVDCTKFITFTKIMKASRFGTILGPRDATRTQRKAKVVDGEEPRKDLVASAIRNALSLMESHDVPIHSGKGNMVENSLVRNVVTDKKKQGWGIRPVWGKQYGETFIEEYTNMS